MVGKEGWVIQNSYQIVIAYRDYRVALIVADFGTADVVMVDDSKGKEKKKKKSKLKDAFNSFKKGLMEGSLNAKEIAKSIHKTLSSIQFNTSPLEGFEGEYGYFFVMQGVNKVGDRYATKHHSNGRVLRNQKGFLNASYHDGQETIEKRKTQGGMITLKEGGGDLDADVLKKLGFVSVNRMYDKKLKFSKLDKNYLHIIEPKKDVFYLIATYSDPDRSDKLLGKYGLRQAELINVYTKNRADMPASWEEARKNSIEFIDRYYNHLRSGVVAEEEKYSKLSEPYRGKAVFYYFSSDRDVEKTATVINTLSQEEESIHVRFYVKDGKQPAWSEDEFTLTVSLGGQTKDLRVKSAGASGGSFRRAPGSHYFDESLYQYVEHKDEHHNDDLYRDMVELYPANSMRLLNQILNEFNIKEGFSGKLTLKLKNFAGEVISEGSINLKVPKGSYKAASSLCLLPSYGTHLKTEEAKIKELLEHRFDTKEVIRVIMSSSLWSDDNRGYRYGRYISARVIYETNQGEIRCKWYKFHNQYFVASGTYAPNYKVYKEGLDRPINCNCDM